MGEATRRRPEILAPAGSPDCLPAAVAGGADAVYLGLRHFNARGRAENFRLADLGDQVAYLHHHGLRCYVVLNTLLHDDEYPKALRLAATAHAAGVDAAILQDLGLWRVLARELPELERHASTQMTVHEPAQIEVLAELGAARVILARELAIDEIRACGRTAEGCGVEIEHFVHGALCYAFSGQCLISNFAGCRSANRGTCAQNCRFDYRVAGNEDPDTALSMKDLALVDHVPALADAGVVSFKIEGRLKGPDYVYRVSRVYREAAEAWQRGEPFDRAAAREALRTVFSRGFTDAPLVGGYGGSSRIHRYRPDADERPDCHLVSLDRRRGRAVLACDQPPEPGIGYRFACGFYTDGFLVTGVEGAQGSGRWRCRVRTARRGPTVPEGTACFRNADHRWRAEFVSACKAVPLQAIRRRERLDCSVTAIPGRPMTVSAVDRSGRSCSVRSDLVVAAATGRPLDRELLRAKLGAFGDAPFELGELTLEQPEPAFLPAAELKRLRRQLVDALQATGDDPAEDRAELVPPSGTPRARTTGLWVAVDSLAAADAAHRAGAERVWLEGLDLWGDAPPEIDGRPWLACRWPAVAATGPHLAALGRPVVAGQLGTIREARAAGLPVTADHHLNVYGTHSLAALGELGVSAAALSLECSCREVARIAARAQHPDLPAIALTIHGRVPAMETRQDHGLAVGERRRIEAVPRDGGRSYLWERRPGGLTVLWEGRILAAPEQVVETRGLVDAWMIEAGGLGTDAVARVVTAYRELLADPGGAGDLVDRLVDLAPEGHFPGHLHQGARELDLVRSDGG